MQRHKCNDHKAIVKIIIIVKEDKVDIELL